MRGWSFRKLLSGTVLLAVAVASAQESVPSLRVMSFNVRYGRADDGENAWPHRRRLLIETVKAFGPDLLGTQEALGFQAEFLRQNLPGYAHVGWSREPDSADGEQCGILFREERFERRDAGQFWLSETPDVPGSRGWDAALPRVATWVRLRDRRQGSELVFLNTHFDHVGEEARRQSARLLRTRLRDLGPSQPWIVAGDFNAPEGSPPWEVLVGSAGDDGLVVIDAWRAAHPARTDGEGTFHAFGGERSGGRIDWILHSSRFETVGATIDRTAEDGRFPSDHFPVTAVLRWRP